MICYNQQVILYDMVGHWKHSGGFIQPMVGQVTGLNIVQLIVHRLHFKDNGMHFIILLDITKILWQTFYFTIQGLILQFGKHHRDNVLRSSCVISWMVTALRKIITLRMVTVLEMATILEMVTAVCLVTIQESVTVFGKVTILGSWQSWALWNLSYLNQILRWPLLTDVHITILDWQIPYTILSSYPLLSLATILHYDLDFFKRLSLLYYVTILHYIRLS